MSSTTEFVVLPPMNGRAVAGIASTIATHHPLATMTVTSAMASPATRCRSPPTALIA